MEDHYLSVNNILKKASEKISFERIRYQERNTPTNINNVCCMVSFGDIRSQFILSSMLMKRVREELKGSKYLVMCSWPGLESLYPYVDEYWQPNNDSLLKSIYLKSQAFENTSNEVSSITRLLNSYIPEDILNQTVFSEYYDKGFTKEFFERFGHVKLFLPMVPSSTILGQEFNRKLTSKSRRVLIYPVTHIQNFKNGKIEYLLISNEFWKALIEYLEENNFSPVIYQDYLTYDLSTDYFDKHLFYKSENVSELLSLMRSSDIVLDIFSGISRYAIAARIPFICCQDRNIFNFYKEYETDDLTAKDLPKEYVFTFPEICDVFSKNVWKRSLFDVIISKLDCMSDVDRQYLPSPIEINKPVLYENVRKIKAKKLGTKFIKVPKI